MAFKKVRAGCPAAASAAGFIDTGSRMAIMAGKATTVRMDPRTQAALENLSRLLKRPMNQLVNEAVQDFVDRRSREVEHDLEATLTKLRAYRQRDPHFVQAIAAIADAEARAGKNDPAEGTVVIGNLAADNWLTSARSNQPVPCRQTFAGC